MTSWTDVTRASGPWVHRADAIDALSIRKSATAADVLLVELDGSRMHTLEELFRAYAREFSLPEYFGWNWAAFDECMTELEWLPARAYLTIVTRAEEVLCDDPGDFPTYLRQLGHIGRYWAGSFALGSEWGYGEVPFHTILIENSS